MCLVISCLFMLYHSFNKYQLTLYSTGYRARMVSLTMKPTTGYLCPKYSYFPETQRWAYNPYLMMKPNIILETEGASGGKRPWKRFG